MGKFKIGLKFDKKFLNTLAKESDSGVVVQNAKHHLALHPIHLNNFNKSVKDLLNEGIAKYNKNLNGILLGYGNIKLLTNMGVINSDSPYLHYDLLVDFYVFKPEIGKEMRGTVNRRSKDHVGLLVYNAFNVSIPKPKKDEDWLGCSVTMGYEVLFKITFIDMSSYLPYIKGELISIISEANNEADGSSTTPLKNKKIVFDTEEVEASNITNTPKRKHKKHKKINDEVEEEPLAKKIKLEPTDEEIVEPKKIKKKKKKDKLELKEEIEDF